MATLASSGQSRAVPWVPPYLQACSSCNQLRPAHPMHTSIGSLHPLGLRARAPGTLLSPANMRRAVSFHHPRARVWASVLLGCQTNTELAASLWGNANCGRRASTPSVPDWQNLIKADCAVPGSRRNRRGISSRTPPSYCSRFAYLPSVA